VDGAVDLLVEQVFFSYRVMPGLQPIPIPIPIPLSPRRRAPSSRSSVSIRKPLLTSADASTPLLPCRESAASRSHAAEKGVARRRRR
jgi:hypothetical protein